MEEKTRCPLCGGDAVLGTCSECGYVIPDEAELEYYTDLMNSEPEDYPVLESMQRSNAADEKPKDLMADVYDTDYKTLPKRSIPLQKGYYGGNNAGNIAGNIAISPQNNQAGNYNYQNKRYGYNAPRPANTPQVNFQPAVQQPVQPQAGNYIPFGQNQPNAANNQQGGYIPFGQNQPNAANNRQGGYIPFGQSPQPQTPQVQQNLSGNYMMYGQNNNNYPAGVQSGNQNLTFSFPNSVRNKMTLVNNSRYRVPAIIVGSIFLPSILLIILGILLDNKNADPSLKRLGVLLKVIGLVKIITIHY